MKKYRKWIKTENNINQRIEYDSYRENRNFSTGQVETYPRYAGGLV